MEILLHNVKKIYGNKTVLDISNLKFESGKVFAVVGPNGSGKTTLLNALLNKKSLTEGEINFDSPSISYKEVNKIISVLHQNAYMFNRSVRENLICGAKFDAVSNEVIEERLNKYLNICDIRYLLTQNAKGLSAGEKQKVALLRCIMRETKILLLDEPTSNMDLESIKDVEKLIMSRKNEENIVIIVTHDMQQVRRLADYVFFINRGRIIEEGDTKVVLDTPKNELVREFLNLK